MFTPTYRMEDLGSRMRVSNLSQRVSEKKWGTIGSVFFDAAYSAAHLNPPVVNGDAFEIDAVADEQTVNLGFAHNGLSDTVSLSTIRIVANENDSGPFFYFEMDLKSGRVVDEAVFGKPKNDHSVLTNLYSSLNGQQSIVELVCRHARNVREAHLLKGLSQLAAHPDNLSPA